MGKLPAFQFYPSDYLRDTRRIPLEARGAWMDLLCQMWESPTRGTITDTMEGFGLLFGVTPDRADTIISLLAVQKVCEISRKSRGRVTITNRRMVREERVREAWREAKQNQRHKPLSSACPPNVSGSVQPVSSDCPPVSSSSKDSSSKKNPPIVPPSGDERNGSRGSAPKRTTLPPDFAVTDAHRAWAAAKGLPSPDLHLDEFRDDAIAKRKLFVDWDAAFRTWMRNVPKFAGRRDQPLGQI